MESTRSQWQPGMRPPWITRVAGGQSPTSSGAESDTEGSSTESEKVSEMKLLMEWFGSFLWDITWSSSMKEESLLLFSLTNETKTHISGLNCLLVQSLHAVNLCTSFSIHVGPALKRWRQAHWGSCCQPQCSKRESQRSTKRRRNWRLRLARQSQKIFKKQTWLILVHIVF